MHTPIIKPMGNVQPQSIKKLDIVKLQYSEYGLQQGHYRYTTTGTVNSLMLNVTHMENHRIK
jgi:hypothetical protein